MHLTLIDCILDNALKGRRALRVLIVLKIGMFPAPTQPATKLVHDTFKYNFIKLFIHHLCGVRSLIDRIMSHRYVIKIDIKIYTLSMHSDEASKILAYILNNLGVIRI